MPRGCCGLCSRLETHDDGHIHRVVDAGFLLSELWVPVHPCGQSTDVGVGNLYAAILRSVHSIRDFRQRRRLRCVAVPIQSDRARRASPCAAFSLRRTNAAMRKVWWNRPLWAGHPNKFQRFADGNRLRLPLRRVREQISVSQRWQPCIQRIRCDLLFRARVRLHAGRFTALADGCGRIGYQRVPNSCPDTKPTRFRIRRPSVVPSIRLFVFPYVGTYTRAARSTASQASIGPPATRKYSVRSSERSASPAGTSRVSPPTSITLSPTA